jgi:hypothetical protein
MSVTISSITTNLNSYIGDTSTDRVSDAERYQAITEATAWLLEELGNEHMVETYELNYLDTINYYKVTGSIPDLLTGADLRREFDNRYSFARKSPRELSEEIAQHNDEPSWAIEWKNQDLYLGINAEPKNTAQVISAIDGLGTNENIWTADTTGSDALNLRTDTSEKRYGAGSLVFDIDVSQSGNNTATVYNQSIPNGDLSLAVDSTSFLFEVYIPDVTEITSISYTWGSDVASTPSTKTNYWTTTVTTDINGESLTEGWNTIKVDWSSATMSGTPDAAAIVYNEFNINYTGSQVDDTHFRLNYLRLVRPEKLIFHYISWNVGQVSGADITPITAFTATTNVPFFSGKYDNYKYCVAQKAASIIFAQLRLRDESSDYESKAFTSLDRYRKNFESHKTREVKSFKVYGVNLRRKRIK